MRARAASPAGTSARPRRRRRRRKQQEEKEEEEEKKKREKSQQDKVNSALDRRKKEGEQRRLSRTHLSAPPSGSGGFSPSLDNKEKKLHPSALLHAQSHGYLGAQSLEVNGERLSLLEYDSWQPTSF
mgnify:CR=1 FL=1